jgi:tetratricopeptide (TPR) repeat protein
MAERRLTRQELVRRRRRSGFVGRRGEISTFRANLSRNPEADDYQFLHHVHGIAGVGKTSLLQQWAAIAGEHGAATVHLADAVHSAVEGMAAISERLSRQELPLKRFEKLLASYRQRLHEAQQALRAQPLQEESVSDQSAPPSLPGTLAAQVGLAGLGMVPVVGAFAGAIDAAQVVEGAQRLRSAVGSRMRSLDDMQLLLDPVGTLTPVFLEDLADLAERRPWVVLFIDVYERTGLVLDAWLRDIAFTDAHGALPANVQIVLAGQGRLNARFWGDWLDLVNDVSLDVFTEQEARALVALQGITAEQVVEVILSLSGRLPVLLQTLAQARPFDAGAVEDPSGTAVERFLKWETDPARRAAALACALPLRFNEDVYRAVVPSEATEQYAWVRRLAFVTDRAGQCRYHDVVRTPMLRLQRTQSPTRWQQDHTSLAELYRGWRLRREEGLPADERWTDLLWREYRCNETYHRLCADPRQALPEALMEITEACEQEGGAVRRWSQLLIQAAADTADDSLAVWGDRLAFAPEEEPSAVLGTLGALLGHPGLPITGQVQARLVRGRAHRSAQRYAQAHVDFAAALALAPDNAEAYVERALTYLLTDQPEQALSDYSRAITLDPELDWAFLGRARALRTQGRIEEALQDLDRALAIDPEYAAAHAERSLNLWQTHRRDDAVQAMARAAEHGPATSWYRLMWLHYLSQLGRHAEVDKHIEQLLTQAGDNPPVHRSDLLAYRGWALHCLDRDSEALAQLEQAAALTATVSAAFGRYGWVLWEASRLEEAEQSFSRALSEVPDIPWCLGGRGITRLYDGRWDEAVDDLARSFAQQFDIPAAAAETQLAQPLVNLLRDHLDSDRAAITAAIRLLAILCVQTEWPGLARSVGSVLLQRPSPRLLVGGVRIMRQVDAMLREQSRDSDDWTLRLIRPILRLLDHHEPRPS